MMTGAVTHTDRWRDSLTAVKDLFVTGREGALKQPAVVGCLVRGSG
jgi:hypothetical protein